MKNPGKCVHLKMSQKKITKGYYFKKMAKGDLRHVRLDMGSGFPALFIRWCYSSTLRCDLGDCYHNGRYNCLLF